MVLIFFTSYDVVYITHSLRLRERLWPFGTYSRQVERERVYERDVVDKAM
jgi:hypothetical protein